MNASMVLILIMAAMYACGIFMLLERSMTRVLIGFLLLGNATNILILIMAGDIGIAPFVGSDTSGDEIHDPLPQALSLTAIVITFGLSAFLLALIYRSWYLGRVDEMEDDEEDVALAGSESVVDDEESTLGQSGDTDFGSADASTQDAGGTS